ncbi:MAG: tRNA (adenosine(37)-N6)-dimethylallyltransferase MiaA [Candidatus Bipolaricaulota bacterium]|nr:MAG: tRNA (adenosine(37)-N6)-dimethylallyltransferase MiaA [Candidatus Bipolaricaulota bacterium]
MGADADRAPAVLVILGATATGKTAIAFEVAKRLDGEILSADSRAFFAGLDIVTDKPATTQRAAIRHHLVDRVPLDGDYDAMAFRRDVEELVPEIAGRDRVPILVGGGTVYLGAVLHGLFEGPGRCPRIRERLEVKSSQELHDALREVDAASAAAIHVNDRLRLVRALEVYEATGRPMSAWQRDAKPLPFPSLRIGLQREREEHRGMIAARVQAMIHNGLVDEAACLRELGLHPKMQAYRTIGVPEALACLDGRISSEEMEERIVRRTWTLARRQIAWFRRDESVCWIDVSGRAAKDLAETIVETWQRWREQG